MNNYIDNPIGGLPPNVTQELMNEICNHCRKLEESGAVFRHGITSASWNIAWNISRTLSEHIQDEVD